MRHRPLLRGLLLAALVLGVPGMAHAGPPLICHPFETSGGALLPWGSGPGWNTPDPAYEEDRLTADLAGLLTAETPVLTRMENIRRAVIYASRNGRLADELLRIMLARGKEPADGPAGHAALFDAGYFVETFRQAAHLHRRPRPQVDGYALVLRAIQLSGSSPEMEFAASLMTTGETAGAHLARARAGATTLLARNLAGHGK